MRDARCINSKCNKLLFKFSEGIDGKVVIKCKCGTVNTLEQGKISNYSNSSSRQELDSYQQRLKINKKNG